jgi:hypothetical protein
LPGTLDGLRNHRRGLGRLHAQEAVAAPGHGLHVARRPGVVAQGGAHGVDGHLQDRVADMAVAPHRVQQLVLADQAAAAARQVHQHREVTRRQGHRRALPQQALRGQVEFAVAEAQALGLRAWIVGRAGRCGHGLAL